MLRLTTFFLLALLATSHAQDWGPLATISNTMGIQGGRLCLGEASRGDIGCPTYAPSLSTTGHVSVTGNLSASKFIGDGSSLTGISGDNLGNHTATQNLGMAANAIVFGNNTTEKIYYYSNSYGVGVEAAKLTQWIPTSAQFVWRHGGTSASTGTDRMALSNSGLLVTGYISTTGVIDAGRAIYGYQGDSASAPGYTWSGDTNTGMYWAGADIVGFSAGGTERFRVTSGGISTTGNISLHTGGSIYGDNGDDTFASWLSLFAGKDANTGAYLSLYGIDHANNSGRIAYVGVSDTVGFLAHRFYSRVSGTTSTLLSLYDGGNANLAGAMTAADGYYSGNGTAAAPAYSWSGDTNTGMYWAAADQLALTTGGTQRVLVNSTGLVVSGRITTASLIDAGGPIYGYAGDSVTAPGYTWSGDTNTGVYWVGADQIGLTTGGVQRVLVSNTGVAITGALDVSGRISGNAVHAVNNLHVEGQPDGINAPSTNFTDGMLQILETNATSGLNSVLLVDSNNLQSVSQTTAGAAVAAGFTLSPYGGTVTVGSVSYGANLVVRGTAAMCTLGNGTGTTSCTSDRRLKQDIQPLQNSLEKITALHGVHFKWKKDPSATRIGLIAQDVEKQFPEVVETDPDTGMKAVAYASLVAPLVEAVKELKAENQRLRSNIEGLKASNDNLRIRLERLESSVR